MNFKERLAKEPQFGSFVTFGLPDIAEYTAMLGFDFLVIDNEHGILNQATICDMVRASQCHNVPAIVRCPHDNFENLHKALDMGADGILIPFVNNAQDVKNIVKAAYYAPKGERGVAFFTRAASYGMLKNRKEFLTQSNKNTFISIQIETVEAVKNLDEILKVDGVDMYFIGPNDLSVSMGKSVDEIEDTILECIQKINNAGKISGIFVGNEEEAKKAINRGVKFLLTSIVPHMTKGVNEYLNNVRKK